MHDLQLWCVQDFWAFEPKTLPICMQVMIFDYDVHHGNGTHDIFYDDPDILFVSTHQQGSYPGTGKLNEVGSGDAQHATINIPLPGTAMRRERGGGWGTGLRCMPLGTRAAVQDCRGRVRV